MYNKNPWSTWPSSVLGSKIDETDEQFVRRNSTVDEKRTTVRAYYPGSDGLGLVGTCAYVATLRFMPDTWSHLRQQLAAIWSADELFVREHARDCHVVPKTAGATPASYVLGYTHAGDRLVTEHHIHPAGCWLGAKLRISARQAPKVGVCVETAVHGGGGFTSFVVNPFLKGPPAAQLDPNEQAVLKLVREAEIFTTDGYHAVLIYPHKGERFLTRFRALKADAWALALETCKERVPGAKPDPIAEVIAKATRVQESKVGSWTWVSVHFKDMTIRDMYQPSAGELGYWRKETYRRLSAAMDAWKKLDYAAHLSVLAKAGRLTMTYLRFGCQVDYTAPDGHKHRQKIPTKLRTDVPGEASFERRVLAWTRWCDAQVTK